ncbi:very-short-patch-repair endonuclease [Rhodococcus sp. LBL1]|nr:very-short-patch-repair endonuclease [Rhodococcus sp. LBL1]MDH6683094.1 very-short-patch-repair endonuclease [Rhodococcus sp. LBL2]
MDARSESVGESRSRVLIHRMRLPVPDLQRVLHDDGVPLGRVDFFFERERVVGEFDGLGKYTEHLRPGQTTEQAVIEEKLREDRIRAAGYSVARWGWRELSTPEEVVRRLRRAFD